MVAFDSSWQKNEFTDTSGTNSKEQLLNPDQLILLQTDGAGSFLGRWWSITKVYLSTRRHQQEVSGVVL